MYVIIGKNPENSNLAKSTNTLLIVSFAPYTINTDNVNTNINNNNTTTFIFLGEEGSFIVFIMYSGKWSKTYLLNISVINKGISVK